MSGIGSRRRTAAARAAGLALGLLLGGGLGGPLARAEDEDPDWEEVIRRLTRKVQVMPGKEVARQQLAVAHNNYAVNLAGQGEWELATHHFNEAIQLNGTDSQFRQNLSGVHLSRAYQQYEARQLDRARESLHEALAANPQLVNAYVLLGEIEYNSQHLKEAQVAWEQALEINPTLKDVSRQLNRLNEELPLESDFGRISQTYFDLRYEDPATRSLGFDIRSTLIQARRLVGSDFAYWPKHKLVVLIYSAESFRALRRETPEWTAGQFDGKIRLPLPSHELDPDTVKKILFHEYTHSLVHDLAHGRCPKWLNEGLAEYQGARYGVQGTEQLAAAAAHDQLVPWDQLNHQFSPGLSPQQVALGYQQSYSLVQYLVERYGFWRIRRILKTVGEGTPLDDVLTKEFHITLRRLQSNWRDWLPRFLDRS